MCSTEKDHTLSTDMARWKVSNEVFLKPQPGRLEAFMRDLARANNIIKRAGGKVRAWSDKYGPNAGAVAVVVEHSD
jgi:hypothetical protein